MFKRFQNENGVIRVVEVERSGPRTDDASTIIEVAWQDLVYAPWEVAPFQCHVGIDAVNPSHSEIPLRYGDVCRPPLVVPSVDEVREHFKRDMFIGLGGPLPTFVMFGADTATDIFPRNATTLCLRRLSLHLWPTLRSHSPTFLAEVFGLSGSPSGESCLDRLSSRIPLLNMALWQAFEMWPNEYFSSLAHGVDRPAMLYRIPLEECGYVPFEQAEPSQLEWIVETGSGGPDCVHTARWHLDMRHPGRYWEDDIPF